MNSSSSSSLSSSKSKPKFFDKNKNKILVEEVFKQQALSEDEIKRLTIEESLTETQRCLVLLKKPDHDQ